MPSDIETDPDHFPCPWCGEEKDLKVVMLEDDKFAVWCPSCGANGPKSETKIDAWDLWDER